MPIQIGEKAPDFALFDSDKNLVALNDFQGRPVVILFFPLAFTSVCTEELCTVRDDIADFSQLNAQVMAISVDSIYTLAKYKEEQKLNFLLLSDFNKEVSITYGSIYETFGFKMRGVSKRSAFVLDKDGNIVYAEVLENAGNIPDFDAIRSALASL